MTRFLLLALVCTISGGFAGLATAAEPAEVFCKLGSIEIHGDGPHYLDFGVGAFDVTGSDHTSASGMAQVRFGPKFYFISPTVGVMGNADGGIMVYAGLYADLAYKNLVLTPMLGAGAYEEGDSRDLGGTFQFRQELTLTYQFENLYRLGVRYAHISNADIHDRNPGENEIYLAFSIPF